MMNVCWNCGLYRADKTFDPTGPYAICPECDYPHPFLLLPLIIVSGASGTGKSTVCNYLTGRYQQAVLLDSDILWRPEFSHPENDNREYFETWLRVCKNINQSGRPVVLFGAGMGVPDNLEYCVERRYISEIHYLACVCSTEILTERLLQRPAWRGAQNPAFIKEQIQFNQWFVDYSQSSQQPPITILDTSNRSLEETANAIAAWIDESIKSSPTP